MKTKQTTSKKLTEKPREVGVQRIVRHLDLFSGIGGFALAAQWVGGIETVGFCEIDEWAKKVLNKNFPGVQIHDDVKTLDPKNYGRIDLVTGGYPCQPFSHAGKREGANDDRHLWPELFRIIKSARPRMVLCENVDGHVSLGLDEVLSQLEGEGYSTEPIIIPACAVGAIHRRERVWIIAYDRRLRIQRDEPETIQGIKALQRGEDGGEAKSIRRMPALPSSQLCGSGDGIPNRVDRLRGCGNAIVPQVAADILHVIMIVDSNLQNSDDYTLDGL